MKWSGVVQDVRENGVDQVSPATVYWPSMMARSFGPGPLECKAHCLLRVAQQPRRNADLHQRNAAGGLVGECESAGGVDAAPCRRSTASPWRAPRSRWSCWRIAGTMALALGILGIYGVISYAVSQRTREIGIRMALGAKKSELLWMFVRSALVLTGVGTAVGLGAAAALMRLMRTLLFGISPLDPVTFTSRTGCPGRCGGTGKLSASPPDCCCRSRRSASIRVTRQQNRLSEFEKRGAHRESSLLG